MTIAAVVPMRHSSERVKGKNYRLLNGRPLYHHIVSTLLNTPGVDEVVIDTDSEFIFEDAAQHFPSVRLLERPIHLRAGETPMNDVLENTIDQIECDWILQTHSTNPFLTEKTVQAAIEATRDGDFDSVFGATRIQARLWYGPNRPINHDPSVLLRTQDLDPVFLENSTLYLFKKSVFRDLHNRIGRSPYLLEVDFPENADIDEERDFQMAESLAKLLEGAR